MSYIDHLQKALEEDDSNEAEKNKEMAVPVKNKVGYCQAQPKLQVKLSLKTELALISINPAPTHPHQLPPTRESLFSSISQ
jgi:hypothetical protein